MPEISIVVPTYNRAHMLSDAIRSVLSQTFTDWELIVVDDGSEDATQQVVSSFDDPRIKYVFQVNKGLPGARNTGIRASTGAYLAFLDSDDLFLSQKLERQLATLARQPALGLVAGGHVEVDEHLRAHRVVAPWRSCPTLTLDGWLTSCPFIVPSVLVRREWLDRVGLFDENMRFVEDWDLWLRLAHVGCAMDWLMEPVCCYRYHDNSMVRNVPQMKAGMLRMLDRFYHQEHLPERLWNLHDMAYSRIYLNIAARAFAGGQNEEGSACLALAIQKDPTLRQGHPPRFLDALASFALQPLSQDPVEFLQVVVQHLPQDLATFDCSPYKTRAVFHAVSAFDAYQRQVYRTAIADTASAIRWDPHWLRNRGLLRNLTRSAVKVALGTKTPGVALPAACAEQEHGAP
jgi:glycosyltransferase involved in cell wall biosynthesis